MKKSLVLPLILLSGLIASCGDMTVCKCANMYDEEYKIHPNEVGQYREDNDSKYTKCKALSKQLGHEEWAIQAEKCN